MDIVENVNGGDGLAKKVKVGDAVTVKAGIAAVSTYADLLRNKSLSELPRKLNKEQHLVLLKDHPTEVLEIRCESVARGEDALVTIPYWPSLGTRVTMVKCWYRSSDLVSVRE